MSMTEVYDGLIERTKKLEIDAGAHADAALAEILEKFKSAVAASTLPVRWTCKLSELENKIPEGWVGRVMTSLTGKLTDPRLVFSWTILNQEEVVFSLAEANPRVSLFGPESGAPRGGLFGPDPPRCDIIGEPLFPTANPGFRSKPTLFYTPSLQNSRCVTFGF